MLISNQTQFLGLFPNAKQQAWKRFWQKLIAEAKVEVKNE